MPSSRHGWAAGNVVLHKRSGVLKAACLPYPMSRKVYLSHGTAPPSPAPQFVSQYTGSCQVVSAAPCTAERSPPAFCFNRATQHVAEQLRGENAATAMPLKSGPTLYNKLAVAFTVQVSPVLPVIQITTGEPSARLRSGLRGVFKFNPATSVPDQHSFCR